jgi:hypothetical protein
MPERLHRFEQRTLRKHPVLKGFPQQEQFRFGQYNDSHSMLTSSLSTRDQKRMHQHDQSGIWFHHSN